MESVILSSPVLLMIFGAALGFNLFDRHYRASCGRMTIFSAFVAAAGCVYAFLLGAGTGEVITVLLLFLCLNLEGWT